MPPEDEKTPQETPQETPQAAPPEPPAVEAPPPVEEPMTTTPAPEPELPPDPVETELAEEAQPSLDTPETVESAEQRQETPPAEEPLPSPQPVVEEAKPSPNEVTEQSNTPPAQERVVEKVVYKTDPNFIKTLLVKARAAIQARKRRKLDKIMALLDTQAQITNKDVQKLLRVSSATAVRYLDILERESRIKQVGNTGKSVFYTKI